jgi:6-phosphogluconolactonase
MSIQWHEYIDANELSAALAETLEHQARLCIAEKSTAFFALAGGSTPLPAYRKLAEADLDWASISMVPTDERWVPQSHANHNLTQLKTCFKNRKEINWLSLVPDALQLFKTPLASALSASKVLAAMPESFDCVVLGMGTDAHTASIFPGANNLAEALDAQALESAIAIMPNPLPPEAPFARVSLTAARLLRTKEIIVAITGEKKRAVLQEALKKPELTRPIGALLMAAKTIPIKIFWSP